MEIGDDPGFIAVCYSVLGREVESNNEASVDTQPEPSLDDRSDATIDKALDAPIDIDSENDYYQPSFAIHTAIPSKRKIHEWSLMSTMRTTEKKRSLSIVALPWKKKEFSRLPMRLGKRHRSSGNYKPSIDTHHETESDARAEDDADFGYLKPYEFGIFRDLEGQARAMDGRVIHVSKDVTEILAMASGSKD
ncbi:hypothetical protein Bca52824_065204 [Brassica carinata]|uniref:Uncharacterized protein n=1 Tax=Brassica carinata TaxID=52824 RepID=A0A8X7QHU1_BRACI|nr:hypothetical protein Bca52824_065204 [Brassica carinata]